MSQDRTDEEQKTTKKIVPYTEIIDLPHPISSNHKQMSIYDRAAQFSPFAALTGYDGAIKETARLTDRRIELDEMEKNTLDEKLRMIQESSNSQIEIEFTYFQPDETKAGGKYITRNGVIKKIDPYEHIIMLQDKTKIPIKEIIDISGELFQSNNLDFI